jgi:hypothetical protein
MRADMGKNFGCILIPEGLLFHLPHYNELITELNHVFRNAKTQVPSHSLPKNALKIGRNLPNRYKTNKRREIRERHTNSMELLNPLHSPRLRNREANNRAISARNSKPVTSGNRENAFIPSKERIGEKKERQNI